MTTRVWICCGVGGAGKTTTAAALGLAHAMQGSRVVVLTIDPAKRLADALGIPHLGNNPTAIDLPDDVPGTLEALMLDRKATWDAVVRRHAPDEASAERVIGNRYYSALSERLTGGHEYMASEKLHGLVASGKWDVVIVDTPPSQHALDFFQAPERIRRILDQRLISALFKPSKGLLGLATRRVVGLVRRLAGAAVLDDLSEFFDVLGDLTEGLRDRGAEVRSLLRSKSTGYLVVVNTPAPRLQETLDFLGVLHERELQFAGCIANRYVPGLADRDRLAEGLPSPPDDQDRGDWIAASEAVLALAGRRLEKHDASRAVVARLASTGAVYTVPDLGAIEDLDGLARVAGYLPPHAQPWRR
jgi:anion-transporting  ArsA/GET3 family ATPase